MHSLGDRTIATDKVSGVMYTDIPAGTKLVVTSALVPLSAGWPLLFFCIAACCGFLFRV